MSIMLSMIAILGITRGILRDVVNGILVNPSWR